MNIGNTSVTVFFRPTRRAFLLQCAIAPVAARAQARDAPRSSAMWVWKDRVLSPDGLSEFAEKHGIRLLFVYVTPTAAQALLDGDRNAVAAARAMRSNGRRVFAVAGEPDWAWGPAKLPSHAALLVRLAENTDLFDGLHFDVEPNALAEWRDTNVRRKLMKGTLKFYDLLRAAAPGATIDAAANPVFATLTVDGSNFMYEIARRAASVSLMAYRSNPERALAWAAPAVAQIARAGRPWRMGVETGAAEPGTSWRGTPADRFTTAMAEFDKQIAERFPSSGYAGLALHDYDAIAEMYRGIGN